MKGKDRPDHLDDIHETLIAQMQTRATRGLQSRCLEIVHTRAELK